MIHNVLAMCSAVMFTLAGCASVVTVPVKGAYASSQVPGNPTNLVDLVYFMNPGPTGNISRYIAPVTIERDELVNNGYSTGYVFPYEFNDSNGRQLGIEWVLVSMGVTYSYDQSGNALVTWGDVTFYPYHFSGTNYISHQFPDSAVSFVVGSPAAYPIGSVISRYGFTCGLYAHTSTSTTEGMTVNGYKSSQSFAGSASTSGPYSFSLTVGYANNGSPVTLLDYFDRMAAAQASAVSGYVDGYDAGYAQGYQNGYQKGSKDSYDNGYNTGYADGFEAGEGAGPSGVITSLFGGVLSVPFNVLNGLNTFMVWDTPIVVIIVSFLFMAIILMFIKRFL